jgi:hypothetical protein
VLTFWTSARTVGITGDFVMAGVDKTVVVSVRGIAVVGVSEVTDSVLLLPDGEAVVFPLLPIFPPQTI